MFTINFRELWSPLSQWLADEMDQLSASAQAKWYAQHNEKGGHTDVSATRVRSTTLSVPVYTHSIPAETNTSSTTPGIRLRLPSKVSALHLKAPFPSGGPFWYGIYAIEMPDVQEGDLLYVTWHPGFVQLISSAHNCAPGGASAPYYEMGNRILLDMSRTTNMSTDATTYFDAADYTVAGVTLLRVNNRDYPVDAPLEGLRYPCWVQVG